MSRKIEVEVNLLEGLLGFLEHIEYLEGVCCCGMSMDNHPEPMDCGHSPVDQAAYTQSLYIQHLRRVLLGVK